MESETPDLWIKSRAALSPWRDESSPTRISIVTILDWRQIAIALIERLDYFSQADTEILIGDALIDNRSRYPFVAGAAQRKSGVHKAPLFAASKAIANYQPYAPSLWKKPAVGPSSPICAYFTIAMAPSAAVPGPLWLFRSVAT